MTENVPDIPKISRRDLFKLRLAPEKGKIGKSYFLDLPTAYGDYRLILGNHGQFNSNSGDYTPEWMLRPQSQGIFIEGININLSDEEGVKRALTELRGEVFYQSVFKIARERAIPLYLGDFHIPFPQSLIGLGIPDAETMVALALPVALASRKDKLTRRKFLKIAGASIASIWLSSPKIKTIGLVLMKDNLNSEWARKAREMLHFTELAHPEDYITTLRNAVLGTKLPRITDGKPLDIVIGEAHLLLAEFLRKGPDFCQRYVNIYPPFILKAISGDGYADSLHNIVKVKVERDESFKTSKFPS